ncbi:MAG: 2-oxoglutarate dehydrogenase complex dihydrolipoyllysine-residue succinyltransferase [Acidiferrobacterales bacterium]|nr:2-oxoglutarate dehydrogenase complex dihydrolipoyllysine-residue succinyltransferase [Acidiferrobacterales bacterium]
MQVEIKTPMLPESVSEATLLSWKKSPGEFVQQDELLIEIETEKIVLEVPASTSGVLRESLKAEGETIYEGDLLCVIDTEAAASDSADPEPVAAAQPQADGADTATEPVDDRHGPAVTSIAAQEGIDLSEIKGTGKDGRVTKTDLLDQVQAPPEPAPSEVQKVDPQPEPARPVAVETEVTGDRHERREPMSRIRRTIADRLIQAQHGAALLTTFNEVDLTEVIALRSKYKEEFEKTHGAKLGFMSFFVKACVESLKSIPAVNAIIDGNDIVYHDYCDVGIAVSSPRGLVVPIVRNAEKMSFSDVEKQIRDFGERARSGTLKLEELSGGTFTITNGGIFGSLVSTPIINPPQSAILGMHKIQERPIAVNGEIVIRPMMYLALTYDHRIIDGREAVTFLVGIKDALEDPSRLLLQL